MAKDILSKYGKASSKKVKPKGNKSGTWATNVLKSFGYSAAEALQEIVPATIDVASATAQSGKTLVDTVKTAKRGDRQLSTALKKNFYYGLASEFWKNSLEDLKSGKFYNKDRLDKFYHESNESSDVDLGDMDFGDMGFGDEDFDTGEESFSTSSFESEDGDTRGSVTTKSKNGVDVTSINVVNDLGPESTMANLSKVQTNAIVDVGTASISANQASTRALLSSLTTFRTEVNSVLSTMDSNIASISTAFADTMGPHTSLAAKFYDDSIKLQTSILEAVQNGVTAASKGPEVGQADANTKQFREYQNVMDMFSTGGVLDMGAYKKLVSKQASRYVESNLILSQAKNVLDQKEGLMMYAKNPLSLLTGSIVKGLISGIVKESLQQFDAQLKETMVAGLNQVSGLRRSDKPILRAIGDIFGVQNKVNKTLDKSAYNKGAVAWSGTDHQALTNVIPTLLRKMLAHQTGTQEIDFDYDKGSFRTVHDMEREAIETRRRMKTSEYGELFGDFRNYIDKSFGMDDKQKDAAAKAMEKFITKMVMDPYGGMHYRKGGRTGKDDGGNRDDIATALGTSSDNLNVELIRSYFTGMERNRRADLTALFGSKLQDQRAQYNQLTEAMQKDPLRYNTKFIESGLSGENRTDAHLKYNKDTGKLSADRSGSSMGSGVDRYGRSSVSYLRDIVSMLGIGIPVLPIMSTNPKKRGRHRRGESGDNTVSAVDDRAAKILERGDAARTRLSSDTKKHTNDKKAVQPRYTTRTAREVQRDAQEGKLEVTQADNVNLDQMVAQADAYMTRENDRLNQNKTTLFDKIVNKLPDSAFKSVLTKVQEKFASGQSKIGKGIDKISHSLFKMVFGDPDEDDRNIFERIKAGFLDKIYNPIKDKLFGDEGILKKLDDKLFGTDGIITKIKDSESMKRLSEKFKTIGSAVSKFVLGEKNVTTGNREGGLLSTTANAFAQIGRDAKDAILGKKGPDGKPLPLDQDDSVLGNVKRIFHVGTGKLEKLFGGDDTNTESIGLDKRIVKSFDAMADRFKERSNELMDNMFGPVGEDGKRSYQREFVDGLKDDLKGQKGFLGASAVLGAVGVPLLSSHVGLLGSMFLPGGPVGGAVIGTAIGIASKSSTFQNYLFGETDEDGNRTGGLITKDFQGALKTHKVGIAVGGLAGLASTYGLLPAFLFPGGPIGGVLGGMAISMAAKSGAFENLMFGPGGSKEEPTGGLAEKFQRIFGKDKELKTVALDAGLGAGLGVLGSFFLPGGPITGALIGAGLSIGTSTEKFKNWFFGEKDPETKKREGGIYGKFTGFMKEKVFDKLTTATKTAQYKLLSFVETNMALPFKYAIQPLLTEAQHAKDAVANAIKGVFTKFSDSLHKHVTEPIGKFLKTFLFNPFKKLLGGIFGGLGKLVGGIIAAPFKALGLIGDAAYGTQKRRGKKAYKKQVVEDSEFGKEATKKRKEEGIKFGLFSQKKYNEETGKWEKVGRGRIAARYDVTRQKLNRQNLKDARFSDAGAYYERDQEIERKKRRKIESKAITAYYEACAQAEANGDPKPNREDFLAAYGIESKRRKNKNNTSTSGTSAVEDGISSRSSESSTSGSSSDTSAVADMVSEDGTLGGTSTGSPEGGKPSKGKKKKGKNNKVDDGRGKKKGQGSNKGGHGTRSKAKKRSEKNRSKNKAYEPHTVPPPKVENVTGKAEKVKTKVVNSKYDWMKIISNIDKNVSKINDSTYGQMNGVGSNINKIYRTLLKKFGMEDDQIVGDNNKSYVGFFGRIRTALNRPFKAIKDAVLFPFRMIKRGVDVVKEKVKDAFENIGAVAATVAEAGATAIKTVISLPGKIFKGIGNFIDKNGPKIVEKVKNAADAISDGIEWAAIHVYEFGKTAIPKIREGISTAVEKIEDGIVNGIGLLYGAFLIGKDKLGKVMTGIADVATRLKDQLGDKLSQFLDHFGEGLSNVINTVKEKAGAARDGIKDAGKKVKDVAGTAWKGAKDIGHNIKENAGGAFHKVGDFFSGVGDKLGKVLGPIGSVLGALNPFKWFKRKATHVIVDGGVLDLVKKVKVVNTNENVWIAGKGKKRSKGKGTGESPVDDGTSTDETEQKKSWKERRAEKKAKKAEKKALRAKRKQERKERRQQSAERVQDTETESFEESPVAGDIPGSEQGEENGFLKWLFGNHKKNGSATPQDTNGFMDSLRSPTGLYGNSKFVNGLTGVTSIVAGILPFLTGVGPMNPMAMAFVIPSLFKLFSKGKKLFNQKNAERQEQGKGTFAESALNSVKNFDTNAKHTAGSVVNAAGELTKNAINVVADPINNATNAVGAKVRETAGAVVDSAGNTIGATGRAANHMAGSVAQEVGNTIGATGRAARNAASRMAQIAKGSRDALLSKFNQRSKEEDELKYKEAVLAAATTTAKATSEHKVGWRSIFGKKGLITGALLLALPVLLKIGPKILDFLGKLNIGDLISDVIGNISQNINEAGGLGGVLNRGKAVVDRVADGIEGETTVNKVDDNGNLVFNEDGSIAKDEKKEETNIVKEVLTPNRARVNVNNGEWSNDRVVTRSSEEILNYAVVKNKRLIGGAIDVTKAAVKGTKHLAQKVATSKPVQKIAEKVGATTIGKAAATAGKVAGTAVGTAKTVAIEDGQKVIDFFMKKGKGALLGLVDKLVDVAKKLGFNIASNSFDTILKPFIKKVFNISIIQKFAKKISKFFATLTGKVAGAAGTAGLLELGFVAYGAIEGATNAAAVFEVRAEDVDWKMRAIATCLKGFTNSSLGAVLDLIDAIGQELSLGSIIKSLANWLYGLITSEEEKQSLKNAQDAFSDDYHDYVSKEYEEYKKQAESSGQVAMSMDEFKQSDLVTSRGEYNSKVNKSLTRKVVDTVKGAGKFIKHPIKSIKSAAKTVTHKVADTVDKAKNFVSTKYDQAKNFIGDKVTGVKNFIADKVSDGVSALKHVKDSFVKGHEVVAEKVSDGLKDGLKAVSKVSKGVADYWKKSTAGIKTAVGDLKSKVTSTISDLGAEMREHGIFGGITSFFKKDTSKAYYDTQGNYYVLQSDGTYTYFNTHGDELATKIDAEVVKEKLAAGLLTEGTIEKDSKAKESLASIKESASKLWDTAKSTVSKALGDVKEKATKVVDNAKETAGNVLESIKGFFFGGKGGSKVADGRGSGETFNGMPYYSQNDPKYRSKKYFNSETASDNGTIAERGCGPAVMASVATKATGKQYDPITMADAAVAGGYSKDAGTTPDYFMSTAKSLGIPSIQTSPSAENIKASLSLGNSIIMQGRGKSETSPYTEEGHYVNVVGLEGDKVIINDPRGKRTSGKYNLEDVLNNTTGMWTFGNAKGIQKDTSKIALGGRGAENMTEMEKALVGTMLSIEKKDQYSQDANKRGMVGRGYGDCSSTTQWVYKTALGVDPGGFTGAQIGSPLFKDVDSGGNIPNEANLRPGDLLFYRSGSPGGGHQPTGVSHVEMYIGNGQIMGHGSGTGPYKGSIDSRAGRYMKARRYTGEASVQQGAISDVSNLGTAATSGVGTSNTTTMGTSSSTSSTGFSSISELLGGLASAIADPILEKLGLKSSGSSDVVSSSSSVGSVSAADIAGNSDKEKIFNFLKANGFTENAAAGAMGCWEEESHNSSYTLEGGYKFGKSAAEKIPQIIASNSALDDYTTGTLFPLYTSSGTSINKSAYMSGGHYYPGFGLAQWTGPRGENLLNFAKSKNANWGELGTQLDFFLNGPGEFKDRDAKKGLLQKLNAAGTPEAGATAFLDGFEMSEGWSQTERGQKQNAKRQAHARTIYNAFAGKSSTDAVQTSSGGMGGSSDSKPLDSTSIEEKNAAILRDRAEFARKIVQEQLREKEEEIKKQKKKKDKNKVDKVSTDKAKVKKKNIELPKAVASAISGISSKSTNVKPIVTVDTKDASLRGTSVKKNSTIRPTKGTDAEYKPALSTITDILADALEALLEIAANTGSTTEGVAKLNKKEFTATVNMQGSSGTTKHGKSSASKNNVDRVPGSAADRSEYRLAKQIASGLLA